MGYANKDKFISIHVMDVNMHAFTCNGQHAPSPPHMLACARPCICMHMQAHALFVGMQLHVHAYASYK